MIEPSLRLPLAVVGVLVVLLAIWRMQGGRPMSLPGDIRYESEGLYVNFPWVSCLLLSAAGNIVLRALQRGPMPRQRVN